jgi:hypothetical protein
MGRPIEITAASGSTRSSVDQTVVSVGPYMFQSSPIPASDRASSLLIASPPHSIRTRRPSLRQPASSRILQVVGVAWSMLIESRSRTARSF